MDWSDRIGRRVKLRDLHILLAVAQSGSMAKAAKRLSVSQPVVSKAIADLEHALGVRLLDRSAQGVQPTQYGNALLARGIAAFDELSQAVRDINFLSDPSAGELRVGSTEPMSAGIVTAAIERILAKHPRIVFHVTQAETGVLQNRELRERTIEVAVGRVQLPLSDPDLDVEILLHEGMLVVAGAHNPLCRLRHIDLPDLMDEPWTLPPFSSVAGQVVTEAFSASGLPLPRPSVIAFSIHVHERLLATGRYLAMLPASVLRLSGQRLGLRALRVRLADRPRPVGAVTLKNRTPSAVARLFIDGVREVVRTMPPLH